MSGPIRRRVTVSAREQLTWRERGWLKRGVVTFPFVSEADARAAWEANRDELTSDAFRNGYTPWAAVVFDGADRENVHPYRKLYEAWGATGAEVPK